jgi:hypothetical protein
MRYEDGRAGGYLQSCIGQIGGWALLFAAVDVS